MDNLIENWQSVNKQIEELKKLKEEEKVLRKQIVEKFFGKVEEGLNVYHSVEDSLILKVTHKLNRKIDPEELERLKTDPDFDEIANNCIKYKPQLDARKYKTLSKEDKRIFDHALIISDGSNTLDIKKVKEEDEKKF